MWATDTDGRTDGARCAVQGRAFLARSGICDGSMHGRRPMQIGEVRHGNVVQLSGPCSIFRFAAAAVEEILAAASWMAEREMRRRATSPREMT